MSADPSFAPSRRDALAILAGGAALPMVGSSAQAAPDEAGHIDVPGGKVWYRRVGRGSKTPLLLLHGGPGAAHDYLQPFRALADDRPVIFYDQLGCGLSDAPEADAPYHIGRFVNEIDAVRHALGLDRIVLYGHSWGSMLAIEYLVTGHGAGVEKLVLGGALASVPQFAAGAQQLVWALPHGAGPRLLALEAAGRTETPEYQKLVQVFYDTHVLRVKPNPETRKSFESLGKSPAYRIMNGPNEFTVTGNIKDWDRRADLGAIRVPTLLVTGEFDEVTLDCHETIRDGVAGSRLRVLPNASHLAMQERPKAYTALVRRFLA
jgi:proline iminopeptidase